MTNNKDIIYIAENIFLVLKAIQLDSLLHPDICICLGVQKTLLANDSREVITEASTRTFKSIKCANNNTWPTLVRSNFSSCRNSNLFLCLCLQVGILNISTKDI
jgi:hypothetical protein